MAEKQYDGDYKKTLTYKEADQKKKMLIEEYRKENKIDKEQMYLLLLREDYRNLPQEEKQKGNRTAELLVISGIITFLAMVAQQKKQFLPFAAVYVIVTTVIYFSGILNPIARQLSNINKLLKKFPEVPSLKKYLAGDKEEKE